MYTPSLQFEERHTEKQKKPIHRHARAYYERSEMRDRARYERTQVYGHTGLYLCPIIYAHSHKLVAYLCIRAYVCVCLYLYIWCARTMHRREYRRERGCRQQTHVELCTQTAGRARGARALGILSRLQQQQRCGSSGLVTALLRCATS